jgi:hypothetical protein
MYKGILFFLSQRVRVVGQLYEEVRLTSGVPQGRVNDIWRNLESTSKLFADDYIMYRKIIDDNDIDTLQIDLDRLGEWAVENVMKINPGEGKAVSFTRARVKGPLNYFLGDQKSLKRAAANI